jgi:hypothetical protein
MAGKTTIAERGDRGAVQAAECQLDTLPFARQLVLHSDDRMLLRDGIDRAVGGHDEQPRRVAAGGERPQERDGCGVAPVQIFEHQYDGPLGACRVERPLDLALHTFKRRDGDRALQRFPLLVRQQPGNLQQPCRRVHTKGAPNVAVAVRPQPLDCLKDRPVRFAAGKLMM